MQAVGGVEAGTAALGIISRGEWDGMRGHPPAKGSGLFLRSWM